MPFNVLKYTFDKKTLFFKLSLFLMTFILMMSTISRFLSLLIPSILVFGLVLLTGLSGVVALSQDANGDNPLQIVIERSEDNEELNNSKTSNNEINMDDLLGAEQIFPFEPGLGNHSK